MKKKSKDCAKILEGAVRTDLVENICLNKSIFGEICRCELRETDMHEIIVSMAEMMGPNPSNLCLAEEIFEKLKFDIANYVIHHEYCSPRGISEELLLWLDGKTNPGHVKRLSDFIDKYLK